MHLCSPVGIDSPGYVQEQISKPAATKKIEESDEVQQPDVVAAHLFRGGSARAHRLPLHHEGVSLLIAGLEKGYYQSTTHPLCEFVRVAGKGSAPGNNPILDTLYWLGSGVSGLRWLSSPARECPGGADSQVFIPIMRLVLDSSVKKFKKEVEDDLQARGFYAVPKVARA